MRKWLSSKKLYVTMLSIAAALLLVLRFRLHLLRSSCAPGIVDEPLFHLVAAFTIAGVIASTHTLWDRALGKRG